MTWYNLIKLSDKRSILISQKPNNLTQEEWEKVIDWALSINKKYAQWLINIVKNDPTAIRIGEDDKNIKEDLKLYQKLLKNPNFPYKNILNIKTWRQFQEIIDDYKETKTKAELTKEEIKNGLKLIDKEGDQEIFQLLNYYIAAELCKNTKWCITQEKYFHQYNDSSPLYVFVISGEPYALFHEKSKQFKNINDVSLNLSEFFLIHKIFEKNKDKLFENEPEQHDYYSDFAILDKFYNYKNKVDRGEINKDDLEENINIFSILNKHQQKEYFDIAKNIALKKINEQPIKNWINIPYELKTQELKKHAIEKIKRYYLDINNYNSIPDELKDSEMINNAKKYYELHYQNIFNVNPNFFFYIPQEARSEKVKDLFIEYIKKLIKNDPLIYEKGLDTSYGDVVENAKKIPQDIKVKLQPFVKETWYNLIKNDKEALNFENISYIPDFLRNDSFIKKSIQNIIHEDLEIYLNILNSFSNNKESTRLNTYIFYDIINYDDIPNEFLNEDILKKLELYWMNLIKEAERYDHIFDLLTNVNKSTLENKKIKNLLIKSSIPEIKNNPSYFEDNIKSSLKDEPKIKKALITGFARNILKSKNLHEDIMPLSNEIKNHPLIQSALQRHILHKIKHNNEKFFNTFPKHDKEKITQEIRETEEAIKERQNSIIEMKNTLSNEESKNNIENILNNEIKFLQNKINILKENLQFANNPRFEYYKQTKYRPYVLTRLNNLENALDNIEQYSESYLWNDFNVFTILSVSLLKDPVIKEKINNIIYKIIPLLKNGKINYRILPYFIKKNPYIQNIRNNILIPNFIESFKNYIMNIENKTDDDIENLHRNKNSLFELTQEDKKDLERIQNQYLIPFLSEWSKNPRNNLSNISPNDIPYSLNIVRKFINNFNNQKVSNWYTVMKTSQIYDSKKNNDDKIWIIDKKFNFYESSSEYDHQDTWPNLENVMINGKSYDLFIAKGRYINKRDSIVATLSMNEIKNSVLNPQKHEHNKKQIENILSKKYPTAYIKWV